MSYPDCFTDLQDAVYVYVYGLSVPGRVYNLLATGFQDK